MKQQFLGISASIAMVLSANVAWAETNKEFGDIFRDAQGQQVLPDASATDPVQRNIRLGKNKDKEPLMNEPPEGKGVGTNGDGTDDGTQLSIGDAYQDPNEKLLDPGQTYNGRMLARHSGNQGYSYWTYVWADTDADGQLDQELHRQVSQHTAGQGGAEWQEWELSLQKPVGSSGKGFIRSVITQTELPMLAEAFGLDWSKTYAFFDASGNPKVDGAKSVVATQDGGFVIAGGSGVDAFLLKTDAQGNELWRWNSVNSSGINQAAHDVLQTPDGGYLVVGEAPKFVTPGNYYVRAIWVAKVDAQGSKLWDQFFKATTVTIEASARSIVALTDGNYAVAGYWATTDTQRNAALYKITPAGLLMWEKAYPESGGSSSYEVIQTTDGGYFIAGDKCAFESTCFNRLFIKADSAGNKLWSRWNYDYDSARAVVATADGGYLVAGRDKLSSDVPHDAWLMKLDNQGNAVWSRRFGGTAADEAADLIAVNGGYLLVGTTASSGAGLSDAWLIKVDEAGNQIWAQPIGTLNSDSAAAITATLDADYAFTGASNDDAWLVRGDLGIFPPNPLILDGGEVEDFSFNIVE